MLLSVTRTVFRNHIQYSCKACYSASVAAATGKEATTSRGADEESCVQQEVPSAEFINRNPRNLEQLGHAVRDKGWYMQWPRRNYYHRLRFKRNSHRTTAEVVHYGGRVVVTASTSEPAIMNQLYSGSDVAAAANIGSIIAQRCLQAGIVQLDFTVDADQFKTERLQAFFFNAKESGLSFSQPRRLHSQKPWFLPSNTE